MSLTNYPRSRPIDLEVQATVPKNRAVLALQYVQDQAGPLAKGLWRRYDLPREKKGRKCGLQRPMSATCDASHRVPRS